MSQQSWLNGGKMSSVVQLIVLRGGKRRFTIDNSSFSKFYKNEAIFSYIA